jgi:NADH-quinone oxidoreductase subunit M
VAVRPAIQGGRRRDRVLFVMLTTFLMPITIAACWGVTHRVKEYMIAFLVLETLMIGVFVALDLVLFYLFFEAGLIPMFLIIGIWGGKDRIYAASSSSSTPSSARS